MVNHYYIYAVDRNFGPFFLKFCSYFPFNAKLCLNGHEYAKRQLAQEGIAFEALDNGVLSCAAPARLQKICDGLSAEKINGFLRKVAVPAAASVHWGGSQGRLPLRHLDPAGRVLLDAGARPAGARPIVLRAGDPREPRSRPAGGGPADLQPQDRSPHPGRFRTRILTQDVTPSLNVYYKNARIKQYHKENRALRTETTINNTYDFGIGKRLHNLPKLREIGFVANRRLLDVERLSHDCMLTEDTFQTINGPVAAGRQRASGLRFADRRIQSRSCMVSSRSGSCPTASVALTCAITSPSFQDATPNRSRKAPSPISFAAYDCTA